MDYFTPYEIDHAIYSLLPFGSEAEIAKRLGKSPGLISRYLNPNDDKESPIYKAAAMLAVLMDIDPEAGESALEIFTYYVERAKHHADDKPDAAACLSSKIRTDARTTAEIVEAIKDGTIDARETGRILIAISEERKVLDDVERLLHNKPILAAANGRLNRNGHR